MHIYIHIYWEYRSQLSKSPVKPTSAGDAKSPKKNGRHLLQGATATAKVNKHILRREMRIDFHLSKCPPSYHFYIRKK